MKRYILIVFLILISSCKNKDDNVKGIKGMFINNSLSENDPIIFDFKEDSLSILYPFRSDVLKNKFTLKQNKILSLINFEFNVDLKIIEDSVNDSFVISGGKSTISKVSDTIVLTPIYFNKINVNHKSMSGYWYSEDFFPLQHGPIWLKFEKNRLTLKSEYNDDINLEELDYTINNFGNIKTLSIKFLDSDAIFFYDKINDKEMQLLTIIPSINNKYYVHLKKISEDEYVNARMNKPKEEKLPILK